MDRILQMILRRVVGRLVNRGVDAGLNRMTRGGQGSDMAGPPPNRQAQTHARQAMRNARRFGRF